MYDNSGDLQQIINLLREISKKLATIITLLMVVAFFTFITGRAMVLEKGFWALMGF